LGGRRIIKKELGRVAVGDVPPVIVGPDASRQVDGVILARSRSVVGIPRLEGQLETEVLRRQVTGLDGMVELGRIRAIEAARLLAVLVFAVLERLARLPQTVF